MAAMFKAWPVMVGLTSGESEATIKPRTPIGQMTTSTTACSTPSTLSKTMETALASLSDSLL